MGDANAEARGLGSRRRQIKKGMIFPPEHGLVAFAVPLFDAYRHRVMRD
jgi:hypothetical protein